MSSAALSRGFGSWGGVTEVALRGFGIGAALVIPDPLPGRILLFAAEYRGVDFSGEIRSINIDADMRDLNFGEDE